MKRILFLFITSLLLLACSNDDDPQPEEQNTEYKIQKFSRTVYEQNGDIYRIDLFFDEAGKVINRVEDFFNNNATFNDSYSYNILDQVLEIQLRYEQEDSLRRTLNDETSNKLQNIKWINFDGSLRNTIDFTYQGNVVSTEDDFGGKTFTFDTNGKLIETVAAGGDIIYTVATETINYSNENITSIHYDINTNSVNYSENYAIEYDDKANPLYNSFNENTEDYIYGFVGNMKKFKYNFSINNYTRIEFTNSTDPTYNYTETKTTQYNEDGYPTSAIIKKNDVLDEEITYEYY